MLRRFLKSILSPANPSPPPPLTRVAAPRSAAPAAPPNPRQSRAAGMRPDVYRSMRTQVMRVRPEQLGARLLPEAPSLLGFVTDIPVGAAPGAMATVVCMADGTTSIYLSSGGGFIGAGFHEPVRNATKEALRVAAARSSELAPAPHDADIPSGVVRFSVITESGIRAAEAPLKDMMDSAHPLAPLFDAVNNVMTQVRLVSSARQEGRGPARG
jgi:hypothetical protein